MESGKREEEFKSHFLMGEAYFNQGQYNKAVESYNQALNISKEMRDRVGEARCLFELGMMIYHDKFNNNYNDAIEKLNDALIISQEIGDKGIEGMCIDNLGQICHDLGHFEKALKYYNDALIISQQIGIKETEKNVYM